jgi:hypothetical protein
VCAGANSRVIVPSLLRGQCRRTGVDLFRDCSFLTYFQVSLQNSLRFGFAILFVNTLLHTFWPFTVSVNAPLCRLLSATTRPVSLQPLRVFRLERIASPQAAFWPSNPTLKLMRSAAAARLFVTRVLNDEL